MRDFNRVKGVFENGYSLISKGVKTRTNPLLNQWADGKQFLGSTRLPKGAFQKSNNCILCHSGVKVYEQYYTGRKVTPKAVVEKKPNSDCSNSPNTATKIKLQCSQFNWGFGQTFNYWGQKVRKINDDWDSNNTFKCFCLAGR